MGSEAGVAERSGAGSQGRVGQSNPTLIGWVPFFSRLTHQPSPARISIQGEVAPKPVGPEVAHKKSAH